MILVRNVVRLKYGRARPTIAAGNEGKEMLRRVGVKHEPRVLTDLAGLS